MLYNLLLAVHLIITVTLILVVLVQTGKGAELGAVFGGGGAVFGGVGATTILHKLTIGLAAAFMATSLLLAISAPKAKRSIFQPITTTTAPASIPATSNLPGSALPGETAPSLPATVPGGSELPATSPAGQ